MALTFDIENSLTDSFKTFELKSSILNQDKVTLLLGRPSMLHGTNHSTPEDLFRSFGANIIDSLDISNVEGANIIHDMNFQVNNSLKNKYQLIYDNGTMEHCFDVKQFLFNINFMLGKNGLICHSNPLNSFINHGFYTFSPCLYLAFYIKNNFTPLEFKIFGVKKTLKPNNRSTYENKYAYTIRGKNLLPLINSPRIVLKNSNDPNIIWQSYFIARKNSNTAESKIPQQPIYDNEILSKIPPMGIIHLK